MARVGGLPALVRTLSESVGDVLAAHLGIDARALAAFRISLGAILVANLLLRAPYLTAFHTDAGILPRSLLAEIYPQAAAYSVFAQFGSTTAQAGLFVIAGSAAVALLVGCRSSLATLASLVLLVSLNVRNPAVLTGGDFLLAHLLFWALLLPIGERDDRLQTSLADYVCRRWNATHEDPLVNVTVTQHVERVRLDGPNPRGRHTVVDYDCTTDSRVRAGVIAGS